MTGGLRAFMGKELAELIRTWRLPVLGGIIAFLALTGPVIALMTPELLRSMQSSQPGVVIQLPDPSWRDAYAQWVKNLSQIVAFVAIISAAGSVSGEIAAGTATLVLTKPVSRPGFVVVKGLAYFMLVVATVIAGALVTQGVTYVVFGTAPAAALWAPTLVWLAFAALLVAVATLMSSIAPTLAAAGVSVGVFFAISLAALWGPAVRFSPAGRTTALGSLLAGEQVELLWPIATSLVSAVACLTLAAVLFSRREL
jgi:ABC-2 type transport system permease protein